MKKFLIAILFATCVGASAQTYTVQQGICNNYPTQLLCGPSLVTDSTGVVEEQIALSFNNDGTVTLFVYDSSGHLSNTLSVNPETGEFTGGTITYILTSVRHKVGKYGYRTTTYLTGVITPTPLSAGPGIPTPIPPQPCCPYGGNPNCPPGCQPGPVGYLRGM